LQLLSDYRTISTDDRMGRSVLQQLSTGSEIAVPGLLLEAAYETSDRNRILWLTDDCPFEEGLHILLLDPGGQVLDAIESKTFYTAGLLNIRSAVRDQIDFTFIERIRYRLSVGSRPKLRFRLPRGWAYPGLRFFHRLTLSAVPGADQPVTGGAQQT